MGLDQFRLQTDCYGIACHRFTHISIMVKDVRAEVVRLSIDGVYLQSSFVTVQGAVIFAHEMEGNPQTRTGNNIVGIFFDSLEQFLDRFGIRSA